VAPEPLAADRTYQTLKAGIIAGKYRPGASFNLQRLADEFGTSITPIRDAIHRMVGERLLAVLPGGGFHLPIPSAEQLRDLYAWHEQLIRQALHGRLGTGALGGLWQIGGQGNSAAELVAATAAFFESVSAASGNREVIEAVANASDRLSAARLREPTLIKGVVPELEMLASLARNGRTAAIRIAVREYHRRRLRRVERIALSLRG
jgi:DNA-binding FadR family transcriptional regulator